ncbi:hypothetical protein SAMN05421678_110172 [Actinopolymorpha cephalotaxi]|uniref:Uncharacterized protein n=1 Tax=Actinopolymorpha cephalotaxi TaxID=504797 RepID=A0A1I2WAA0_9ACTN|nr:hypothetical protein [Actinopolymorpha cephalotaxi]SFG98222.1 hypothetical protein SAMN05421678_110172 [Actinopolymorpha cephalotaxi]
MASLTNGPLAKRRVGPSVSGSGPAGDGGSHLLSALCRAADDDAPVGHPVGSDRAGRLLASTVRRPGRGILARREIPRLSLSVPDFRAPLQVSVAVPVRVSVSVPPLCRRLRVVAAVSSSDPDAGRLSDRAVASSSVANKVPSASVLHLAPPAAPLRSTGAVRHPPPRPTTQPHHSAPLGAPHRSSTSPHHVAGRAYDTSARLSRVFTSHARNAPPVRRKPAARWPGPGFAGATRRATRRQTRTDAASAPPAPQRALHRSLFLHRSPNPL